MTDRTLEKAQQMFKQLPESEMERVGDFFEEVLLENDCVITGRNGTVIDWEMNPDHKDIKKILKRTRNRHANILHINDLNPKEVRLYEKRKRILSERYKSKAQKRYILNLARGKVS